MRSIQEVEQDIVQLRRRWPAHSLSPSMLAQLEELEIELERAREAEGHEDA